MSSFFANASVHRRDFVQWLRGWAKAHGIVTLAIVIGTLCNAVSITNKTMDLTKPDGRFATYYDEVGDGLFHGRFDVSETAINTEAFIIHGKRYGYFGPGPGLVRWVLNALVPRGRGHWTRLLMLTCCALCLTAVYSIHRSLVEWLKRRPSSPLVASLQSAAVVLFVAIGSTLFFVTRSPILYHEAITFGVTFAMLSYAMLLRYMAHGRRRVLVGAAACAMMSFASRSSVGLGAVLAVGMVVGWMLVLAFLRRNGPSVPRERELLPAKHARGLIVDAALATMVVCVVGSGLVYRNLKTFGNVAGVPSLATHIQFLNNPQRLANIGGGKLLFRENFKTNWLNYFRRDGVRIRPGYRGFGALGANNVYRGKGSKLDWIEGFVSIPTIASSVIAG